MSDNIKLLNLSRSYIAYGVFRPAWPNNGCALMFHLQRLKWGKTIWNTKCAHSVRQRPLISKLLSTRLHRVRAEFRRIFELIMLVALQSTRNVVCHVIILLLFSLISSSLFQFADLHPRDIEVLWGTLCQFWPNNLKVVLRYLVIIAGLAPNELMPCVSSQFGLLKHAFI